VSNKKHPVFVRADGGDGFFESFSDARDGGTIPALQRLFLDRFPKKCQDDRRPGR